MSQTLKSDTPQVPARRRKPHIAAGPALDHVTAVFLRAGFADPGFLLHWPAIAGVHIASVAQPVRWQETPGGAVVTLRCEPAAAVLLQHETRALLERCNGWLGAGRIARFKFAPGPLPSRSNPSPHPAPDREPPTGASDLQDALNRLSRARARLTRGS